jgi:hypothetical protein
MPTIRVPLELAAEPFERPDGTWAVHCRSCSHEEEGGALGLHKVSLDFTAARRVADWHNKVVHEIR